MNDSERSCVEAARDIAEDILMESPMDDADHRVVEAEKILRIVQELNAALNNRSGSQEG